MDRRLLLLGLLCCMLELPGGMLSVSGSSVHSVIPDSSSWSPWSPWSPCSRSCGSEGLQTRKRVCLTALGCKGNSHAWRVCALNECPQESTSLRDEQCQRYNDVPYQGNYHTWRGAQQADSPCNLDCQAETDPDVIKRFATHAEDGTRCSGDGSLKLCLEGVCEEMGCDLELRSGARLDQCGLCGGDGASCAMTKHHGWSQKHISRCSVSCGGGLAMVVTQCLDLVTNKTVTEDLCDASTRPREVFAPCNENKCPARWEVSEWSWCQAECNGLKTRKVECVSDEAGAKILVDESLCVGSKPESELPCTNNNCPSWYAGAWSGCSVSCGRGLKQRSVICRNESGQLSAKSQCSGEKPSETAACHSKCTQVSLSKVAAGSGWEKLNKSDDEDDSIEEGTIVIQDEYNDELEDDEDVYDNSDFDASESMKNIAGTSPNFIVDAWSPCSASCGEGMRFRNVECKIFMEFSKTVATLPDKECPGVKPAETEICVDRPSCSLAPGTHGMMADTAVTQGPRTQLRHETKLTLVHEPETMALLRDEAVMEEEEELLEGPSYTWKIAGFTTCTASCLGGLQESIVICVEAEKESPVAPYFCDPDRRLEIEVRTCNENPCPPRWNVSDFTTCSKSCGGGTQSREVQCIQEVAHGDHNIIQLADSACPQPPPRGQQFCHVTDCPPSWQTSPWTKCSKRCGGGVRYRKVRCQQLLSLGQLIDKSESLCEGEEAPSSEEECNMAECKYVANPKIRAKEGQNFVQSNPGQAAIKLKVGGVATVYQGTTVKISCPVRHYDKSQITWAHGALLFHSGRRRSRHTRVTVSSKGCIKIKNIEPFDSGTYTCMASKSSAKIQINVKSVEKSTTPGKNKIWLKNDKTDENADKFRNFSHGGKKSNNNGLDQPKLSKGKWNSNKQNSLGNGADEDEKPSKSDKWNLYSGDDDYFYWDSINNHVEKKKKTQRKLVDTLPAKMEKKKKRRRRNRGKKNKKHPKHTQTSQSPLTWQPGPWSLCSKTCGGGVQYRQVGCVMQFSERNNTQDVPLEFCQSALRSKRPAEKRRCGLEQCFSWIKSPWSECAKSECVARNTGLRTRTVQCIRDRRSLVEDTHCLMEVTRPRDSQPCHNTECQGVWVTAEWSQCSKTCGKGRRRRSVQCEWLRGGPAPETECSHEERPLRMLDCFGPVCHQWPSFPSDTLEPRIVLSPGRDGRDAADSGECEDTSKFCGLIRSEKMCASPRIQTQCCLTCSLRSDHP